MMNIRQATKKDIPALLSLLSQVLEIHHRGRPDLFRTGAVKYTESELCEILSDKSRPVFVSEENGNVLAYAFCILKEEKNNNILNDIKTLYIDDLCVDEAVRGRHIGSQMYEFLISYAKKEGCYNVTLNVWALNESAEAFSRSLGMTVQKTQMETIL